MQTLKILFWNLIFLSFFTGLCFTGLEFYLRTYQTFSTETVSAVGIPIFEADEINSYRHKPRAFAKNGYGIPTPEIKINNLGLRNDENFNVSSKTDPGIYSFPNTLIPGSTSTVTKNILMIGDSFTFGTGVDQSDTFSALLQQQLNSPLPPLTFSNDNSYGALAYSINLSRNEKSFQLKPGDVSATTWQVWNAGNIGYSIGNYYLLLKQYAALIPLDTVVINIFVANDITELRRKTWIKNPQQDLIRVHDEKISVNKKGQLDSLTETAPKSLAWHWIQQRLQVLKYKLELEDPEFATPTLTWPVFLADEHPAWDPKLPKYWEKFFQGMQFITDYATEKGIKLHFVLIPMDVQVDASYRKKYARIYFDKEAQKADRPQTEIMNFCRARQLNCLDLLPFFRAQKDRDKLFFNYNADPHFDNLGHQVTAKLIEQQLKD